jgi:hypothetical protein
MNSMYICSFTIYVPLFTLQLVHVHAISGVHSNPPTTYSLYTKTVSYLSSTLNNSTLLSPKHQKHSPLLYSITKTEEET